MRSRKLPRNTNKVELPAIKIEALEEESAVEIGVGDVFHSSDEEKDLDLVNQIKSEQAKNARLGEMTILLETLNKKDICANNKLIKEEQNEDESGDDGENEEDFKEGGNFNVVENLHSEERLILNFSKELDTIPEGVRRRDPKEINWADVYKTHESTDCQEDLKKVIMIEAPLAATIIEPHEFTILDRNDIICNHCHQSFRHRKSIQRHIRNLHRDVSRIYRCPYCPFKSKWTIQQHILLKHKNGNDVQWFTCHTCDKKFKKKAQLRLHVYTHLSSEQLGDAMVPCSICPKTYKTTGRLIKHIRFVHNKEKKLHKRYTCKDCEYNCVNMMDYKRHIEVCHPGSEQRRTYECEECDYKTKFKYLLRKHCKKHKTPFCCEKCAYVAPSSSHLKLHQLTHQTEIDECHLRYRCDKCNYKTYRLCSFNVHKLNHLKPNEIQYFYCYHCDFKAKRKDNLKTHVLRHFKKEEVAFQCFACDFSTKERSLLTTHIKNHSQGETHPQ